MEGSNRIEVALQYPPLDAERSSEFQVGVRPGKLHVNVHTITRGGHPSKWYAISLKGNKPFGHKLEPFVSALSFLRPMYDAHQFLLD